MLKKYFTMIENSSPKHLKYIDLICAKLKTKEEKEFAKYLYTEVSYEDLCIMDNNHLARSAASTFNLLKNRKKDEFKINIFQSSEDAPYAVLEIINNDVPFIIDSISNELKQNGYDIHLIAHPIVHLHRDKKGDFSRFEFNGDKEAIVQFHLTNKFDNQKLKSLKDDINEIMECVYHATSDWRTMVTKMIEAVDETRNNVCLRSNELREESIEFLEWLVNNHFVFLGCFETERSKNTLKPKKKSELGLLKSDYYPIEDHEIDSEFENGDPLMIRKWESRSIVHRTAHMDVIIVKRFDRDGKFMGAYHFLGLFTSTVYYQSVRNIPLMRKKVSQVVKKYGYPESSHNCKELITALESFPRGEILQMTDEELYETATGIVSLSLVPRVKVFIRKDNYAKFIGTIIFIPERKFSTEVREVIEDIVCTNLKGSVSKRYVQIGSNDSMTRLQLVIKTELDDLEKIKENKLEDAITKAITSWEDNFLDELKKKHPLKTATRLFDKYKESFDLKYRSIFAGSQAVHDLHYIESCAKNSIVEFDIYTSSKTKQKNFINLKIYSADESLPLSSTLPIIENLGLQAIDEITYKISAKTIGNGNDNKKDFYIHHYRLKSHNEEFKLDDFTKQNIIEALEKVWDGDLDDDRFNSLIIYTKASWAQAKALRAYAKFLKQTKFPHSMDFVIDTLVENAEITNKLIDLFELKFNPSSNTSKKAIKEIVDSVTECLKEVESLAADKVIKSMLEVVLATQRTNFYQKATDGKDKKYLSLKIKSAEVSDLPFPRPYMEIFVYSTKLEAVHLRGGPVARGGLRWSDRTEDYRTEVLGLMKAQMTKNSVIVPVGSKGGFVVKSNTVGMSREEFFAEGVECYKTFLSGLLDITDNIINNKIIKPKDVVCHDGDDPYLVVAADKGTATFSDYANEISENYGFWLGDAFASGGSAGYDHKAMGITAKGAWVSVVRHFQEMGYNIDKDPFTVIGVGDMSGDVFGNGMLLSNNIKLVAAFNHLHIFIDPNPDPKASFKERQRLFKIPRSSWSDYKKELISKGGGIFDRSQKSIPINAIMKEKFGIEESSLSPNEFLNALLKAEVDLFWNGGIGTYMKAESENHAQIGDKANDGIRVNGTEFGARIVGEGGNLGCTQLGRIEYAKKGGRINTDFIDNSAGVDCSDHEVNIKIGVSDLMRNKKLKKSDRDKLLEKMTEDVSEHVLKDNYKQTLILSIEQNSKNKIYDHVWLMKYLETNAQLDRKIEYLPSDSELMSLMKDSAKLTRPELSILLAYSKNYAAKQLLESKDITGDIIEESLISYFPKEYSKKFRKEVEKHKLRKEIINTILINDYINIMGCASFHQIIDDLNTTPDKVIRAFIIAKQIFDIDEYWAKIQDFSSELSLEKQTKLYNYLQKLVQRSIYWILRNKPGIVSCDSLVKEYCDIVYKLKSEFFKIVTPNMKDEYEFELNEFGELDEDVEAFVSEVLKSKMFKAVLDIKFISDKTKLDLVETAKYFYNTNDEMHIRWLIAQADSFVPKQYYQGIAMRSLVSQMRDLQTNLVVKHIEHSKKKSANDSFLDKKSYSYIKFCEFINDVKSTNSREGFVSTITIAIQRINDLVVSKAS